MKKHGSEICEWDVGSGMKGVGCRERKVATRIWDLGKGLGCREQDVESRM